MMIIAMRQIKNRNWMEEETREFLRRQVTFIQLFVHILLLLHSIQIKDESYVSNKSNEGDGNVTNDEKLELDGCRDTGV